MLRTDSCCICSYIYLMPEDIPQNVLPKRCRSVIFCHCHLFRRGCILSSYCQHAVISAVILRASSSKTISILHRNPLQQGDGWSTEILQWKPKTIQTVIFIYARNQYPFLLGIYFLLKWPLGQFSI